MLEELFNLVKGSADETVINNPAVPNDQNNEVIAEATNTVASGLRNMVAGGGLQNILSLFGGNNGQQDSKSLMSNPIVNMMIGHFASKLMSKFNLGGNQANSVASSLIPSVISNLVSNTNDPNNSGFSIDKLLHSITGGQSTQVAEQQQAAGNTGFNFQDLISQFTGGGQQGGGTSGGGGLMDIVSQLAGGAQSQQQQNGGSGLMDLIKGFIK
ncbi:hypothetical protein [Ferruginibacter sp. SUN106]|uniref:hypothetical protein n=1 Tax=Ferruginibacter sp. SUN106 TaxID=2978348 RepID=UPI003D35C18D